MPRTRKLSNCCWIIASMVMLLGAVLGIAQNANSATASEFEHWEFKVDGVSREALAYIPATAKEKSTPIVFVFHGHGGRAQNAARMFAMNRNWPDAISIYMQGLNTPGRLADKEGKAPGWQQFQGDHGDRDLKFFDAV